MHRILLVGLVSLAFVMPVLGDSARVPAATSLAAQAQEPQFKADFTAEPGLAVMQENTTTGDDPFAKGQWIWTAYAGGAFGDESGEIYLAHLGIGYHVLDNLSFNLEGVVALVDGDPNEITDGAATRSTYGGGFNLIIRWHFWRTDRFSVYLDGGSGIIAFDEEFPGHGTNLNFTPQIGFGFTCELNDTLMLMAGARWYHLSNARHHGIENNPGFDAGLIYAGLAWPF